MGLDAVELVIACEDEFGIAIPDEAAGSITTPGMLTDYIYKRLRTAESSFCPSQHGFYHVRQVMMKSLGARREQLRPDSEMKAFLAGDIDIKSVWRQLSEALGDADLSPLEINPKARMTLFWLFPVLLAGTLYLWNISLPLSGVVGVIYMMVAEFIAQYFRDTIPQKYQYLKDFIPYVTSSNEKLWQRDDVLARVMELTSEQSGVPLDSIF
ncbi:acyl carrier protein [Corallincola holothuriorum]|uniref:hypothetical protein n=1 Tax=Corallincola holothuriorum TaxID=2282215 RepID=UPI0026D4C904